MMNVFNFTVSFFLFHLIHFWTLGLVFAFFDFQEGSHVLYQFKVQKDKHNPLKMQDFWKCCRVVLKNQILVSLPMAVLLYFLLGCFGSTLEFDVFPSISKCVFHFTVFLAIEEVLFYHLHRMFHIPWFYRNFHKVHHEFKAPIAIASAYCAPLEHALVNLFPALVGPVIMGTDLYILSLWIFIGLTNTMLAHSGYDIPFLFSSRYHDFHHEYFMWNYGVLRFFDWFYRTDIRFKKHAKSS